jgi:putative acetyltransferase
VRPRYHRRVLIRRERPDDVDVIRAVTAAAFGRDDVEAPLIDRLRAGDAWLPSLSLVAVDGDGAAGGDEVVGHVVCSRARIGAMPVLGLGPLSVRPDRQRQGVGLALMHAVLGAADALDEPLVALLGDPRYYARFRFRRGEEYGIEPPQAEWRPHFQVRALAGYRPEIRGRFAYASAFDEV